MEGRMSENRKEYLLNYEEVMKGLDVTESGLTREEADKRLSEHGPNKLKEGKKKVFCTSFCQS